MIATNNIICIVTNDKVYSALLDFTISEFNFNTVIIEDLFELSIILQKFNKKNLVALFIDIDIYNENSEKVLKEIERLCKFYKIYEVKLIFLGSKIDKVFVKECYRFKPFAILVKPISIPKFVEILKTLKNDYTFFEHNKELIDLSFDQRPKKKHEYDITNDIHNNYLSEISLKCPVCGSIIKTKRFKLGKFPNFTLDTDFYPICDGVIHPEVYSIAVCDTCLYANYHFNFENCIYNKNFIDEFYKKLNNRLEITENIDFSNIRTELHGIKAFELAAISATELKIRNFLKYAGEFYLKASWLCRRIKDRILEQHYQKKSLYYLQKAFEPYKKINQQFPTKSQILSRLQPFQEVLSEKGIIILCFLIGDIYRRLGDCTKAREYFQMLLEMPFLEKYEVLLNHIYKVIKHFS